MVEEVKLILRTFFAWLKDSHNFEQSLIEKIACEDEIDRDFATLYEAGSPGMLPNVFVSKLA